VLAVGVGTFEFLAMGVSLVIVRQVPLHEAFHSAGSARVVYAPAVLAALGGAICGRAQVSARSRRPLVLAWGVAAGGVLGLADALFPSNDGSLLSSFAPDAVKPITSALAGPLALALLVTARALARRKRRAWQVALVLQHDERPRRREAALPRRVRDQEPPHIAVRPEDRPAPPHVGRETFEDPPVAAVLAHQENHERAL
jgi:hypothetical protein